MTLDKFGSGCRCLLRARENSGKPYVGDEAFLARHRGRYPDWDTQPGAAGPSRLIELSKLMGVARHGQAVSDYEQLIASHNRGEIVLILSRDGQRAALGSLPGAQRVALMVDINDTRAKAWAPSEDGSAEVVQFPREAFLPTGATTAITFQPE